MRQSKLARDHFNLTLKVAARDDAYKHMWTQIYKSRMRYEPRVYQESCDLADSDVEEFENFFNKETESRLPYRYVVVGFPSDSFEEWEEWYQERTKRISKKKYIGKCWWTFELTNKEGEDHPHVNIFFESEVEWLAKSRIIDEFSKVYEVEKNYVNVDEKPENAKKNILKYMQKDSVVLYSNFKDPIYPSQKRKKQQDAVYEEDLSEEESVSEEESDV